MEQGICGVFNAPPGGCGKRKRDGLRPAEIAREQRRGRQSAAARAAAAGTEGPRGEA